MFKINDTEMPNPKSMEVAIMDIDNETNRDANGNMHRDRIGVKRKITMEWPPLETSKIQILLNAVSSVFFNVTFLDPMSGGYITKTMYVGDRTDPVYSLNNNLITWNGLKMNFIER